MSVRGFVYLSKTKRYYMFSVIYTFKVKPGLEEGFIESWVGLTQLIYSNGGSLGSKLHKAQNGNYVAYAQWPSREAWESSGSKLPIGEAKIFRDQMRSSCSEIETKYELELIEDLTKVKKFED